MPGLYVVCDQHAVLTRAVSVPCVIHASKLNITSSTDSDGDTRAHVANQLSARISIDCTRLHPL